MHKPIATTVQQFDEPDRWATNDNAKNTAMLFYATNVHLHNLVKDTAPRLIWHNEKIHGIACTHRSHSPGSEINTMLALHQIIQTPLPPTNYKWWVRIQNANVVDPRSQIAKS